MPYLLTLFMSFYLFAQGNVTKDPSCVHTENRFNCVQYIKNYDGDTITFNIPDTHPLIGKNINVRVFGIDSAEIKTKNKCEKNASLKAKEMVAQVLKKAKRIDLVEVQRDKYFRILADVVADGVSIKTKLISEQLAYAYDGGTKAKTDWCNTIRVPAQK